MLGLFNCMSPTTHLLMSPNLLGILFSIYSMEMKGLRKKDPSFLQKKTALKITAGQQLLTVMATFAKTEKLCSMVTMAANTYNNSQNI